jgi:acetyl esterase/lipase
MNARPVDPGSNIFTMVYIRSMKNWLLLPCLLLVLYTNAQTSYKTEKDIPYYSAAVNQKDTYINSQCKLDIYYPEGVKDFPTIVWFHGGGLTGGGKEIPQRLMAKGYAVIGVGYRFSPKVKAPAYIEDAAEAVAWAFKHIKAYGGSTKLIFLSGHSAGGYLAAMITLDKKYLQKLGVDADSVAGVIPFSGQMITHFTVREERGIKNTQPVIDEYAPLFHVRADAPPFLLITGDPEMELLGRYEENAYMKRMMGLAGHKRTRLFQLQGFDHGGMAEPAFPLLLKEVAAVTKEIKGTK